MAINITNGVGPGQNGTNSTRDRDSVSVQGRGASAPASATSAQGSDSVELSNQVQSLQTLEASIKDMPDIDQSRVDNIKSALANGEYEINYDRLAAAIQRFEGDV
ncbi:MAG: flagellar biosynthesis anti-sigma factor FlgM [Natronospirillum sp.]